ncbi:MAG: hypothetical protein HZA03_07370 [Nitrospinae bacterium]|nr:hypothetical protein [Nitrospinota bacterium]
MTETFKYRLQVLMKGDRPYTFARKCGIEKGLFQNYWQKGKIPTYENLLKLQRGTGCSIDWLLTGQIPALEGRMDKLRFVDSGAETGARQRRFVHTALMLRKIFLNAPERDITAVELLLNCVLRQATRR